MRIMPRPGSLDAKQRLCLLPLARLVLLPLLRLLGLNTYILPPAAVVGLRLSSQGEAEGHGGQLGAAQQGQTGAEGGSAIPQDICELPRYDIDEWTATHGARTFPDHPVIFTGGGSRELGGLLEAGVSEP